MKKIIRICNKDFTMKSSAYTQFAYKDETGRSLLHDIERFQNIDISNAVEAMDDMSETLLQIAYVMIEESDDVNKPTNFIDFLKQLEEGLKDVSAAEMANIVIAYEPVWAIGTGKTATPEIAEATHQDIRNILTNLYGAEVAENVTVQYGGSVSDTNVDSLMAQKNIDGALVGGASLKLAAFTKIAKFEKV